MLTFPTYPDADEVPVILPVIFPTDAFADVWSISWPHANATMPSDNAKPNDTKRRKRKKQISAVSVLHVSEVNDQPYIVNNIVLHDGTVTTR